MEFKEGVHKSSLRKTMVEQEPEPGSGHQPNKRTRWFLALAMVLLVCIVVGSIISFQVLRNPHTLTAAPLHPNGWCVIPGAHLSDNVGDSSLNAVAVTSGNDAWAVGSYARQPLIEHWNGQRWSVVASPPMSTSRHTGALYGITALAPNDAWAVGTLNGLTSPQIEKWMIEGQQQLIEHWDGQHWNIVPGPAPVNNATYSMNSIAAVSANDIWIIGHISLSQSTSDSSSLIEHWNGNQWLVEPLPAGLTGGTFDAITTIAQDDVWAAGYITTTTHIEPLIAHWDGHQWSVVASPKRGSHGGILSSISGTGDNDIWTFAPPDFTFSHWDGQQWQLVGGPKVTGNLQTIHAISPNNAWVVGGTIPLFDQSSDASVYQPIIEHWDGKRWSSVPQQRSVSGNLSGITSAGGRLWAVGVTYTATVAGQQIASALIESNTCS